MNRGFDYRESVGPHARGASLLDYMARRYRHSSKAVWEARIAEGRVTVDGMRVSSNYRLRCGQLVVWARPPWSEPAAPLGFAVLYLDDSLIAVAKPSGLPTLPGAGFVEHTLLNQVRSYAAEACPLHRLGRWTSGVVLFSRSRSAASIVSAAWREKRIVKRYRALATGCPAQPEFAVETPIGRVDYAPLGRLFAASAAGKPSRSRVRLIERREGAFLADVIIETGRPHQIRIHLAAAGHPLVGDPLYASGGVPYPAGVALPGDPGYQLHAASVSLLHPTTGKRLTIDCPCPPQLRAGSTV